MTQIEVDAHSEGVARQGVEDMDAAAKLTRREGLRETLYTLPIGNTKSEPIVVLKGLRTTLGSRGGSPTKGTVTPQTSSDGEPRTPGTSDFAPVTPELSPSGVAAGKGQGLRRNAKRRAAQVAEERVAGQLRHEASNAAVPKPYMKDVKGSIFASDPQELPRPTIKKVKAEASAVVDKPPEVKESKSSDTDAPASEKSSKQARDVPPAQLHQSQESHGVDSWAVKGQLERSNSVTSRWIALLSASEKEFFNFGVREPQEAAQSSGQPEEFLVKKVAGICCHHCQRGKELVRCDQPGCRLHYCTECLKRCYPGLGLTECKQECPRCRGICNCKYALRMDKRCNKVPPEVGVAPLYSAEAKRQFADHVLNSLCGTTGVEGPFHRVFGEEVAELRVESSSAGKEVGMVDLDVLEDAGYRVVCSRCFTTVVNVFRTCNECGYDLCPQCCADERAKASAGGAQSCGGTCEPLTCPGNRSMNGAVHKCGNPLKLMRLNHLSRQCIEDLVHRSQEDGIQEGGTLPPDTIPEVCTADSTFMSTEAGMELFQQKWSRGCPFVIRGVHGRMLWTPHLMKRAATEKRKGEYTADIIDCQAHQAMEISIEAFFNGYTGETRFDGNPMYKIKDWPTEEAFQDKLKRLYYDFVDMLPLKAYTHPFAGPLNLACQLPEGMGAKPDLGPKCYIAYGRKEEQDCSGDVLQMDGDSVTKLHLDVSDAVNVLVHCQQAASLTHPGAIGEGGAVWHIFSRESVPRLKSFLLRHRRRFVHRTKSQGVAPVQAVVDPILDQSFYLSGRALALLEEEEGVRPWVIRQRENDAVLVPAGCPHQVRNVSSCIKVAMDFVSPESMAQIVQLTNSYRSLPQNHFAKHDKLQAKLMLLNAVHKCGGKQQNR